MVAVEASLVLNEIATGERMTPGQNEAESRYVAAPCDTPMYLFQLDFWTEAFPRHWHEEWGIAVIHQGVNRFWFRGAWHSAGPGAIIVVPPGEVQDGGLDKDSVWGERMCYVPVDSMTRITEAYTGRCQELRFSGPIIHHDELAHRLRRLHRTLASGDAIDPLEADEFQIGCLGPLLELYGHAPVEGDLPEMPAQIRTVLEVFHDDPSLRITLAELARRVSLSTFQLIRAFQHHVGLPPHAYLKQLRITRAQRLLREGLSIADAALAAGFSDQPHLTREFGRTLGMTPGQYVGIRQRQ